MPLLKNNVADFCGDFARFGPDRSMEFPRFLRSFSSSWGKHSPARARHGKICLTALRRADIVAGSQHKVTCLI
jgi:hypothetical protein